MDDFVSTAPNATEPEWVHWFNHKRLFEGLGYMPPAEYEAAYHCRETGLGLAA